MCDDDLDNFVGHKLQNVYVGDSDDKSDDDWCHEIQFLNVITDRGNIQLATHNEHNGYYGGFSIQAKITSDQSVAKQEKN